jgi:1-acyl-sn-glycerol-3-phosphate acyltransferase
LKRLSLFTRAVRGALLWLYRRQRWTVTTEAPIPARCVMIGVPHTSNWDFLVFLGATHALGIRPAFMGKHSLFNWPMGGFMREMGGVAVDRSSSRNYVEQMAEAFASREEMQLVVAPEGTRKGATKWKTGFYHIACAAGVPIVPAWLNYQTRQVGMGKPLFPSGNFAQDMEHFARFYAVNGLGKHPEKTRTDFAAMLAEGHEAA